jgi:hypothetical protein
MHGCVKRPPVTAHSKNEYKGANAVDIENNKNGITDEERRAFVKTAGKLAVYTPPAMMLLVKPSAYAASSCNNGFGNGSEGCSPDRGAHHGQDD